MGSARECERVVSSRCFPAAAFTGASMRPPPSAFTRTGPPPRWCITACCAPLRSRLG